MTEYSGPVCAICGVRACSAEPGTKDLPAFCPMLGEAELLAEVEKVYLNQERIRKLVVESARTESSGYCQATRIEEIMDFARRIGAHTLGVAHCVGHDSLFFMHSKAPVTVLVAKDRVLGHNPVACLYTSHSYYGRLTSKPDQ